MDETIVIKIKVKLNAQLGTLVRIGSVTESRDLREMESNSCVFCNRKSLDGHKITRAAEAQADKGTSQCHGALCWNSKKETSGPPDS